MPRGDKSAYTDKQKRQAEHIEDSEVSQGRPRKVAERIAWATVNKQDGGGKRSGTGRKAAKKTAAKASKKTTKKVARKTTKKTATKKTAGKTAKKRATRSG